MSGGRGGLQLRAPAPPLQRLLPGTASLSEATIRRRIGWIWGLLYLNVLPYTSRSPLLHLPVTLGKVVTQGALIVALVLALSVNRRAVVRPNLFLFLLTLLCVTSLMMSVRGYFGLGSTLRAVRLVIDVVVLWLLTPWWGRDDLLLFRFHRRALYVVLAVVLVGAALFPGLSFAQAGGGRLGGTIWPVPPTQVAHYAAILAGWTIVLWFTDLIRARTAALVTLGAVAMLLLTHTRTALVALLVGVLVAALSLYVGRQRVRKALGVTVVVGGLVALSFAPFLSAWFTRGETTKELTNLTGRTTVWAEIAAQPRSGLHLVFGYGMSNDSYNGLSIDSSWYATYLDQGLFGDVVDGSLLLLLLLIAAFSPRGPRRALALFLIVYCALASFTEVGLGESSPYLLDLAVAMSVLMGPPTRAPGALPAPEPRFG